MIKGIVFDLDGTLVDSLGVTFEAFNHGINAFGVRTQTPAEILSHFGPGEVKIIEKFVGPENVKQALKLVIQYFQSNLGRIGLHAGVTELLENLKSKRIPLAIFTGRSHPTTRMILEHHRLTQKFVTVVAHEDVKASKPHPEGLLLAVSRMGLKPDEVLFVGDSAVDLKAAHAAHATSVAAAWDSFTIREELLAEKPHHVIDHVNDLWKLWERMGAQ